MLCTKCKTEIPDNSIYCMFCGKKQIKDKLRKLKNGNGMGSVYKLPGRRRKPWAVRMSEIVDGVQRFRYIGYYETKTEAEIALANERINPTPPKVTTTFSDLFEEWRTTKAYTSITKATQDNYTAAYKHLAPLHKAQFTDIRAKDIQRCIDKTTLSKSSKEKIRLLCSRLYKYAMEIDLCNKNYAQFVTLDREEKKEKEIFTKAEIEKIEQCGLPYADTIIILIYTGLRISELLNMRKKDVDLETRTLRGGLKTDAGRNRIVPIHNRILPYIISWYDSADDYLIHNQTGSPVSADYYRRHLYNPIIQKLGISPSKTPHCARHTCATALKEAGADTEAIRKILGHSDYAFTAETYTHANVDFLLQEMSKMN